MSPTLYVPLQTEAEARASDRYTMETFGLSANELMERAGYAAFDLARRYLPATIDPQSHASFLVLCGKGNNGGDGQVCARYLQKDGHQVHVLELESLDASTLPGQLKRVRPALVIDALFGTGLTRPLAGKAAEVVSSVNRWRQENPSTCRILAIDLPSGILASGAVTSGPHIQADVTLTFSMRKIAHVSEPSCFASGEVICRDIGLVPAPKDLAHPSAQALLKSSQPARALLKPVFASEHKGHFAHVGILEGAPETRGASRLAALAALRAGAGLVTLLVSDTVAIAPGDLPEFMKRHVTQKPNAKSLERLSALVLGPGLGNDTPAEQQALALLQLALTQSTPLIIDAGALTLLSPPLLTKASASNLIIATPHPGEAAKLLGVSSAEIQRDRLQAAQKLCSLFAKSHARLIWVLKGASPIVAEQGRTPVICEGGVPSLAIGGSGDVLSGIIAALLARTVDPFDAAVLGVSAHLAAGRRLSERTTRGHLASEIAQSLPPLLFPSQT